MISRVVHGYGFYRGIWVTGVMGMGAVLDSATPRWTVNLYLWFAGISWVYLVLFTFFFTVDCAFGKGDSQLSMVDSTIFK
jgi:hypothetical protein